MRYRMGRPSRPGDVNPTSTFGTNRWGLGDYLPTPKGPVRPGDVMGMNFADRPWLGGTGRDRDDLGAYMSGLGNPIYDANGNVIGDDGSSTATASSGSPGWLTPLVTGITSFFTGKQQLDTINQVNQINIQRAAAGLPPISVPIAGPQVNVGVSSDVQNLLIYGGLGIGAIWLLTSFMKRRG